MTDPTATDLVQRLNLGWRLAGPDQAPTSFKQRLVRSFRRALSRLFGPQETFNSTLVQLINAWPLHELPTAFDRIQRFHEALAAREQRIDAAMAAIRAENQELRTTVAVLRQQLRSDRSEGSARADVRSESLTNAHVPNESPALHAPGPIADAHALSASYVGFEDQFRGSAEQIRERLASYLPFFAGARDVLDIGCGRGEFLRLLGEQGVSARGIDLNVGMIDVCRQAGLDATYADALSYLRSLPDGSLGGLFAAQVVEHLEPGYLTQVLDAAFAKLRPGAPIVLETINPACWFAFFESYVRDITHVRPLHPDTLRFLLIAAGFQQLEIQYRAPYPEHEKLQHVPPALGDAAETLNANVDKLNSLFFTYLDYAAIGRR